MTSSPSSPTDQDRPSPTEPSDGAAEPPIQRRESAEDGRPAGAPRVSGAAGPIQRRNRLAGAGSEAGPDGSGPEGAGGRQAPGRRVRPAQTAREAASGLRKAAASSFDPDRLQDAGDSAGPTAGRARIRPRHRLILLSFLVVVILPLLISAAYLWGLAKDQYASTVGFSVRREDTSAAVDILGGLTSLTKSSSSDTDILYEYLRSQKLVADMDARVGLRALWSKPSGDPVFTLDPGGSIEDLVDYWQRMVRTSYDSTTGLIEVRVLAFDPADATRIAQALLDESARMINDLSATARADAVRYSEEELKIAEGRLREAREAVTAFRVKNQIVDPTTDFQTQAGLVGTLENQLAAAEIEVDLLAGVPESDPRLVQAKRRAEVIVARIAAERAKVGTDGAGVRDLAALAADYERLVVDREFAEKAYVAALSTYDSTKAESARISRYLAAHVLPTTAEVSRYPERLAMLGLLALFLGLVWSIATLVAYSLKDRR